MSTNASRAPVRAADASENISKTTRTADVTGWSGGRNACPKHEEEDIGQHQGFNFTLYAFLSVLVPVGGVQPLRLCTFSGPNRHNDIGAEFEGQGGGTYALGEKGRERGQEWSSHCRES